MPASRNGSLGSTSRTPATRSTQFLFELTHPRHGNEALLGARFCFFGAPAFGFSALSVGFGTLSVGFSALSVG